MSQESSGWSTDPAGAAGYPGPPTSAFGRPLAEWWKRLVAYLVDSLVLGIPMYVIQMMVFVPLIRTDTEVMTEEEMMGLLATLLGAGLLVLLLLMLIPILYFGIMNGSARGQTLGKMAMRIQVRDEAAGGPIGVGRGILRYLVVLGLSLLCVIPALVDGLSPLWDAKRQSWHDKAGRSVVVDV